MENGVKNVDNSLRLAEEASSENVQLRRPWKACLQSFSSFNKRSLN